MGFAVTGLDHESRFGAGEPGHVESQPRLALRAGGRGKFAGFRRAIDVRADVLARYVGSYQLAPNLTLEVTLTNGALFVHPTDQPTFRLWPESETDFFLKELDAQLTFQRDASGTVTGLVLHQGGQNMTAPKQRS
jgi:hypothetical protein